MLNSWSAYLNWHGPQVGAQEEEPHELVGIDGDQVADLPHCQLPHGNVGCAQAHDFVVDFGLSGRCHTNTTHTNKHHIEQKVRIYSKLGKFCISITLKIYITVYLHLNVN